MDLADHSRGSSPVKSWLALAEPQPQCCGGRELLIPRPRPGRNCRAQGMITRVEGASLAGLDLR